MMRRVNRLILAAILVSGIAAPAAAHVPERCGDLAVEGQTAGMAVSDAVASLGRLVTSHAPRSEIALAVSAVFDRLIEHAEADVRFMECMADAE